MFTSLWNRLRSRTHRAALLVAVPVLALLCLASAWSTVSLPRVSMNIQPVLVWTSSTDPGQPTVAQFGLRVGIRIGRVHLELGWPRLSASRVTPAAQRPQPASPGPTSVGTRPLSLGS